MFTKAKAYVVGFATAYRESRKLGEGRAFSFFAAVLILTELRAIDNDGE